MTDDTRTEEQYDVSLAEIRELLVPDLIGDALAMGKAYMGQDGNEIRVCFPSEKDPGCLLSYVVVSYEPEEWDSLSEMEKQQIIADTLYMHAEAAPEYYIAEVSHYIRLMQGK